MFCSGNDHTADIFKASFCICRRFYVMQTKTNFSQEAFKFFVNDMTNFFYFEQCNNVKILVLFRIA